MPKVAIEKFDRGREVGIGNHDIIKGVHLTLCS